MFRLDKKLAKIRSGKYAKGDFIIADAKDGDMSNPIPATGPIRGADGSVARLRTRAEFLEQITEIIRQDLLDIMLTSASNLELLTEAKAYKGSAVKPAFRANDTTDIWGARAASYGKSASRPFFVRSRRSRNSAPTRQPMASNTSSKCSIPTSTQRSLRPTSARS